MLKEAAEKQASQHKQQMIAQLKKQQEAYKKALAAKLAELKAEHQQMQSELETRLKKERLADIQEHLRVQEDEYQRRVKKVLAQQAEDIREERWVGTLQEEAVGRTKTRPRSESCYFFFTI